MPVSTGIFLFKSTMEISEQSEICSKSTIKTLTSFWWLCFWLRTDFAPYPGISMVDFEQVNADWVFIHVSKVVKGSNWV